MTLRLPRRRFLQVVGAAAVLAACGDDGDSTTTSPGGMDGGMTGGAGSSGEGGSVLAALFSTDRAIAAGQVQRLPLGVFTEERIPRRDDLPDQVQVTVNRDGTPIGTESVGVHGLDLPFPYYPVRATLPEPGLYELVMELDDGPSAITVQAFDPAQIVIPRPGGAMPSAPTPTTADARGVDPLCTRFEPCPFHDVSLDEALGSGPVALLIGTPAYCQTGVCGPVLEVLMAAAPDHPGVTMIHAEVYANPREVGGNIADPGIRPAPIMDALSLGFEPVLFLVGSDGVVVERLDNVYDRQELDQSLQSLA